MEKLEKNHLSGQFSMGGAGTEQSGTGTDTHCSILTNIRILAIACSFFIRFE